MRKQRALTAFVAACLVVTPSSASDQRGEPALQPEVKAMAPLRVRTMTVPKDRNSIERQFFGQVTARDTVSLAFEVGGRIAELEALEGQTIRKGTPIAALDLGPFKRRVERAELALQQAERETIRAHDLSERNVSSRVRAQDAQTAYELADVEHRDALAALEDAQMTAPFDAQIADRIASLHAIVEPGQPILRIHDLSELRVRFDLPERVLRHIEDLEAVEFFGHLPGEEQRFELEFREFRAETGEIGQSYVVSLAVVGDRSMGLLPGQSMIVRGAMPRQALGTVLPMGAIATSPDGGQYVVAVEEHAAGLRARHVPVRVTAPTGSGLIVPGLSPELEIVAVGAHAVADGAGLSRYSGLSQSGN